MDDKMSPHPKVYSSSTHLDRPREYFNVSSTAGPDTRVDFRTDSDFVDKGSNEGTDNRPLESTSDVPGEVSRQTHRRLYQRPKDLILLPTDVFDC